MDLLAIARGYSLRRVTRLEHPALPPNAILCGKLIAATWLATGQVAYVRAAGVPFGGIAIHVASGTAFVRAMVLLQLTAILTILCSSFFRAGCTLLAVAIAITLALDQPHFSNNRAFCAALLAMLALGDGGRLARVQVAFVYGCAALDKLLAAAWRSGEFMRTWTADMCRVGELWSPGFIPGGRLPATCALSKVFEASPTSTPQLASALVIALEFTLALGYARSASGVALLAVLFHSALFVLTGSTFGMFFYAGLAAALLVVDLQRLPASLQRSGPWFLFAAVLAGPWVRPWHAAVFATAVLALGFWMWNYARHPQTQQRS